MKAPRSPRGSPRETGLSFLFAPRKEFPGSRRGKPHSTKLGSVGIPLGRPRCSLQKRVRENWSKVATAGL